MEGAEQNMKAYMDMYKKLLSPQVTMALSTLKGIAGKSKLDLTRCFPHDNDNTSFFHVEAEVCFDMDEFSSASGG